MKFSVDAALCCGHGQCESAAPEVFSLDDEGFNAAVGRTGEVPAGLEAAAGDGAGACPEQAIRLLP